MPVKPPLVGPLCALFVALGPQSAAGAPPPDPFEAYLRAETTPADGFVDPLGQRPRVVAPGNGRVVKVDADGGVLVLSHLFYENHHRRQVESTLSGVTGLSVSVGDEVLRGQALGRATRRTAFSTSAPEGGRFLRDRASLFVPQKEPLLVLIDHARYRFRVLERGRTIFESDLGFGQAAGEKTVRGDNRSPKGMYFVVEKSRGPFAEPYGAFYGGHWIKVNYPNAYDAARGEAAGLISTLEANAISAAWRERRLTSQGTGLGSGIGFHGWASEWDPADGRHLSWGCFVLHNRDVGKVFDLIPKGTMVVAF